MLKTTKRVLIGSESLAGILGLYYGTVLGASMTTGTYEYNSITKNDSYTAYENIPAGYYNKHPLKICVSDKFNDFDQYQIRKAL